MTATLTPRRPEQDAIITAERQKVIDSFKGKDPYEAYTVYWEYQDGNRQDNLVTSPMLDIIVKQAALDGHSNAYNIMGLMVTDGTETATVSWALEIIEKTAHLFNKKTIAHGLHGLAYDSLFYDIFEKEEQIKYNQLATQLVGENATYLITDDPELRETF